MGLYEGVNRANQTIDVVSSLVSSKREFILKQTVNSILLFIILMVFGCMDFATLTFHGEYLLTPSYWGIIGTKIIAAICALNIGINIMLDNEIRKSEELQRNISIYNRLIELKDTDFEHFVVHVFNPAQKKKAYLNKINRQIYLLNKFSSKRSKLLFSSDLPENQKKKTRNLYCIKRKQLEELKSDEYIEKNLDSLVVNYQEVDPAVFELEINGAKRSAGVKVTGNILVGRTKESSSIILSMLGISMLTTSFGLAASAEEFENQMVRFWHYFVKVIEDVGVVLWQFFNGTLRTRRIVSTQLTQPYAGRNEVLKAYINWREETKAKESAAFKEINKEEETIEIDEEQARKLGLAQ